MKKLTLILALIFSVGISFAHAQGIQQCYTTNGTNCISVSPSNPLPVVESGASSTNITTATSTNVKSSAGTFTGFSVNTGGAGSSLKIYDDADGTCDTNLKGTYSTATQTVINGLGMLMSNGICALTSGGTPADITILYR